LIDRVLCSRFDQREEQQKNGAGDHRTPDIHVTRRRSSSVKPGAFSASGPDTML